jgi:hypothetical protein
MKRRTSIGIGILMALCLSINAAGQGSSFSGEWKINREKSAYDPNQLFMSKITVALRGDSLLTIRTYSSPDGQEYPFTENLSLDGKECKIVIYEMPRTSKAVISPEKDSINVASVTTFNGNNGEQNLDVRETWKLENKDDILTISFTNTIAGSTSSGKHFFDRVK